MNIQDTSPAALHNCYLAKGYKSPLNRTRIIMQSPHNWKYISDDMRRLLIILIHGAAHTILYSQARAKELLFCVCEFPYSRAGGI